MRPLLVIFLIIIGTRHNTPLMASNLRNRITHLEQSPAIIKAAEQQRELREWEEFINYHMEDLKHFLTISEYEGSKERREVLADDFIEYQITVMWRLMERHPVGPGGYWERELAEPIEFEVCRELNLRWYGFERTPEEEAEALRLCRQMNDDLEAGVPREQSEAAAIVEQSWAGFPRLNYIYKNLPEIKPEGWEWQL